MLECAFHAQNTNGGPDDEGTEQGMYASAEETADEDKEVVIEGDIPTSGGGALNDDRRAHDEVSLLP